MTVEFDIFDAQKLSEIIVADTCVNNLISNGEIADYDSIALKADTAKDETFVFDCEIADAYGIDFNDYVKKEGFIGKSGQSCVLSLPKFNDESDNSSVTVLPDRVLFLSFADFSLDDCRLAGLQLGRNTVSLTSCLIPFIDELNDEQQIAFFNGIFLSCYRQTRIANSCDMKPAVSKIVCCSNNIDRVKDNLNSARFISEATLLARTLECIPSNVKNPMWLAENFAKLIENMGELNGSLSLEVLDSQELNKRGFNAITAVGNCSITPPCMAVLKWVPAGEETGRAKLGFVGKGITYDTGGLSLKPREAMVPMKTDMSGTATVVSAILSIAKAGLNVEVVAVAPMAENAFGSDSYRPGDVVRSYGGTSIEIVNTDAEGRMVLADGIDYVVKDLDVDVIVDIATLTGAATVGLGRFHAATYSNDDKIWSKIACAGSSVGEHVWRMPLSKEYRHVLDSDIADIAHCENDSEEYIGGGSITAALFLEHFVKGKKWCHLDIAGVGRAGKASGEVTANQPTGFGAALLYAFAKQYCK